MAKKKRQPKKKKGIRRLFNSRGNIVFNLLLGIIIIGSIALVSGIFPKNELTPRNPNSPIYQIDPEDQTKDPKRLNLQLKTINFKACAQTAAVDMLLDTTGSMGPFYYKDPVTGETKMDKLKKATKLFTSNLSDDSVIGIQRFSQLEISEVIKISLYGTVKDTIDAKIDALPNIGGTPTASGLRFSLGILKQAVTQYPEREFSFIFVSDGDPTDGYSTTSNPDPAQEIKKLGVTVYSIGILDPDQVKAGTMKKLLDHIASDPSKSFIAPDGNQLTEIYNQIGTQLCQKPGA